MKPVSERPLVLLLVTGLMLGMNFPLGKLALAQGANPLAWAMLISLVPGLVLMGTVLLREGWSWTSGEIGFVLLAGLLAYVVPNTLTFLVIPHIGSGLASLTFALSPVATAMISLGLGVRPPGARLLAGVGLGFSGAVLIALARDGLAIEDGAFWLLLAFLIPVSLANGNVYRTARWPAGMSPLKMAGGATLSSGVILLLLTFIHDGPDAVTGLGAMPGLSALQVAASLTQFLFFFRLQWVGGPTYLSQIGYVAAAVGLAAGVLIFGERYPFAVWLGAGLIGSGIVVSNWPRRRS
jgi:drug/metabolite transporter (DMT)-like permease